MKEIQITCMKDIYTAYADCLEEAIANMPDILHTPFNETKIDDLIFTPVCLNFITPMNMEKGNLEIHIEGLDVTSPRAIFEKGKITFIMHKEKDKIILYDDIIKATVSTLRRWASKLR